jgi:hypothetical protein
VSLRDSVTGTSFFGSEELYRQLLTDVRDQTSLLHTSDTFNNQVLAGNCTGFVETTNIDTSSERNAERLGTEDGLGELPYSL